jgi:hypothetical protein
MAPTTTSLNLTYTSNGSVEVSTTQKFIGNYSIFLPGSSDNRLVISNFPGSTYLSGSWTIEWFLYLPNPSSIGSTEIAPITFSSAPSSSGTMLIYSAYEKNGNNLIWYVGSTSNVSWDVVNRGAISNPNTEVWNHIALCYTLNSGYKFFCNGKLVGSSGTTTNIGSLLTNINLGAAGIATGYYYGGYNTYIDGLRISNTVRYSADYTVPTSSSYTEDSNTIYFNSFEGSFQP